MSIVKEAVLNYDVEGLTPNIDPAYLISAVAGENVDMFLCYRMREVGLRILLDYSVQDFINEGFSEEEAIRLHASFLLTKRIISDPLKRRVKLSDTDTAKDFFSYLKFEKQEQLDVAFLDTKNQLIKKQTVFIGSLNSSIVHPREIFREAVKLSAASIIIAHQHPSGDPLNIVS